MFTLFIKFTMLCLIFTACKTAYEAYYNKVDVAKRKYTKEATKLYKSDFCTKADLSEVKDIIYDECSNCYEIRQAFFAWQRRMNKKYKKAKAF